MPDDIVFEAKEIKLGDWVVIAHRAGAPHTIPGFKSENDAGTWIETRSRSWAKCRMISGMKVPDGSESISSDGQHASKVPRS